MAERSQLDFATRGQKVLHRILALCVSSCVCSVHEIFSYSPSSFSSSNRWRECSLFMGLEARLSELEAGFCSLELPEIASVIQTR